MRRQSECLCGILNSKHKLKGTQNHFEGEVIARLHCGHFSLSIILPVVCIERTINQSL
jgi:hypothetical protein